jgi:hypothetical protein
MDGRVLGAGALSLILAACGGEGGGGGSAAPPGPTVTGGGSAPSSGPGDTMAYFPLAAGNQWLYNSTDSSTNTPSLIFDVTAAVNGTKTVQGQLATTFTRSNSSTTAAPIDQYYASSGGGISYLGTTDPADTITPLLIPYPQLLFPVVTGTVSSISGKNLAFGKDATGKAITLSLTQTIVNSALETVSVPAGTLSEWIRTQRYLSQWHATHRSGCGQRSHRLANARSATGRRGRDQFQNDFSVNEKRVRIGKCLKHDCARWRVFAS